VSEKIYCTSGCINDLCEHSMYAAPTDGTEFATKDMMMKPGCPYYGGEDGDDKLYSALLDSRRT